VFKVWRHRTCVMTPLALLGFVHPIFFILAFIYLVYTILMVPGRLIWYLMHTHDEGDDTIMDKPYPYLLQVDHEDPWK